MRETSRLVQAWLERSQYTLGQLRRKLCDLEATEGKLLREVECGRDLEQNVMTPLRDYVRENFLESSRRVECGERCLVFAPHLPVLSFSGIAFFAFFSFFAHPSSLSPLATAKRFFEGCQAAIVSLHESLTAKARQVSEVAQEEHQRVQTSLAGSPFFPAVSLNNHIFFANPSAGAVLSTQTEFTSCCKLWDVICLAKVPPFESNRRRSTRRSFLSIKMSFFSLLVVAVSTS